MKLKLTPIHIYLKTMKLKLTPIHIYPGQDHELYLDLKV